MLILINNNNSDSKMFSDNGINNPKRFFYAARFLMQNTLFNTVNSNYTQQDLLNGEDLNIKILNQGK